MDPVLLSLPLPVCIFLSLSVSRSPDSEEFHVQALDMLNQALTLHFTCHTHAHTLARPTNTHMRAHTQNADFPSN